MQHHGTRIAALCMLSLSIALLAYACFRRPTAWSVPTRSQGVKAVWSILVGPGTGKALSLTLRSLYDNVLVYHPRPVLLFYGDDIPPEEYTSAALAKVAAPEILRLLQPIVLDTFTSLPDSMRTAAYDILTDRKFRYPFYQSMCRWNLLGMLNHPAVRDLDYYGRLDTDSRFREPVTVDIFDYMHEKGLHYAWVLRMQEDPPWIIGMWDWSHRYVQTHLWREHDRALQKANRYTRNYTVHGIRNTSFRLPWNEIEFLDIQRFRQPDIMQFAEAADATHRIYTHRWGDGPLRYLELLLFLNMTAEVEQLSFIDYWNDKGNRWKPRVNTTNMAQSQPS